MYVHEKLEYLFPIVNIRDRIRVVQMVAKSETPGLKQVSTSIVSTALMVLLAAVLLTAAYTKVLHLSEFWDVLETVPILPEKWLVPVSGIVIGMEVLLPFGLMNRITRPAALRGILILSGAFSFYSLWRVATAQLGSCGCFTGILNFTSLQMLSLDVAMMAASLYVFRQQTSSAVSGNSDL